MLTLQNAYDAFNRYKQDITNVPSETFIEWCDFVNKYLYRQISTQDPERFINTQSYSVTSSPQTSALPSDFKHIRDEGTGLYLQNSDGDNTRYELMRTGYGATNTGYYISKSNIVFTEAEDNTYILRYIPKCTTLDALTDYFSVDSSDTGDEIIPEEYLDNLVKAIDVLYDQWDEDIAAESYADQRFARALADILEDIRKEVAVIGVDNYSQYY